MKYAAFGIFTNHGTMHHLGGEHAEFIGAATVEGWRFRWRGCADTEQAAGETLHVAVWEIDDAILKRLDHVEGYPRFYDRVLVQTSLGEAWMYTMAHKDGQSVSGGMFRSVMAGHIESGLPVEQVDRAADDAEEYGL